MSVERSKLQLLGAGCMFLAAKYEIYPPGVGEFAFITDNTYTKKQVVIFFKKLCSTEWF